MKFLRWVSDNILFIFTLFLLAFIPLYPKLPLLDVQNTWVYIRVEDFIVVFVLLVWALLLFSKKITLKTPLTLPIILFWLMGGLSTIHAVLIVFPRLSDVYSNVAFLSYIRRIEYTSLFFIAFAGMKDKKLLPYVISILTITLFLVVAYGFGQKYLGFPAYLTMNEEFAKGVPIRLSSLSRVPSTFAGHYDLAAYLVLIIPILTSLIFGFKNWLIKIILSAAIVLGFGLLFMTVSRVSFFVLLLSLATVIFFQKKKFAVIGVLLVSLLFLILSPSLLQRFGSTIKEVDVLVSAKNGEPIGHVSEVDSSYIKSEFVRVKFAQTKNEIESKITEKDDPKTASKSAIIVSILPPKIPLVVENNSPTGENLPQGTGYVNLPLSPVSKKLDQIFFQKANAGGSIESSEVIAIRGDFLLKRALAYDLSFTTRFQGEWPKAIEAFKRNIFFGSGYSSVSLAVDNNYLRLLGEVGFLGSFAFLGIFLFVLVYIKKVIPLIHSPLEKSFLIGFVAGLFGLALNAILIDVFEASKIAFLLWLLTGITVSILYSYKSDYIEIYSEIKKTLTSTYAVVIYLFIVSFVLFSSLFKNYFVGDDFTWLRWAAQSKSSFASTITSYFTEANGFFYRPGTKLYFLFMYSGFWLNQTLYYLVSISLHFIVSTLFFFLSKKILKNYSLSILSAFLFLILSGYSEAVFWISSTGFLFNAVFVLLSLLAYISWEDKKKDLYFFLSIIFIFLGLLFHEIGTVIPLLILAYKYSLREKFGWVKLIKNYRNFILFSPVFIYLVMRYFASSHWFNGDYSYNLLKLPYNLVGNALGYLALSALGPASLNIYQVLRSLSKEHIVFGMVFLLVLAYISWEIYKRIIRKMTEEDRKIVIFSFLFFLISLLPFLGLGNISSRYSYLSSMGFIMFFVFFLKKIYSYLLPSNGKFNTFAVVAIITCMFSLIHIIQLQKIQGDWYEASLKTKRFLVSIEGVYSDSWTKEKMDLYFAKVPIRQGDAWLFPVGLDNALWFVFRNPYMNVHQVGSVEDAFNVISISPNKRVFEFDHRGMVTEKKKTIQYSL